jgi:hypothetical protein
MLICQKGVRRLAAARSNTGDYGVDCWHKGPRQRVEFDARETDAERGRPNEIFDAVMVIFASRQHGCGVTAIRKGILGANKSAVIR